MLRRIVAYIIDYLSVSILLMILCMMVGTFPIFDINPDYPFLIISFIFFPWMFWKSIYLYPNHYGNLDWITYAITICIIVESVVYSIEEYQNSQTIGKRVMHIKIKDVKNKKIQFYRLLIRNVLKIISKYLIGLPFFVMLLNNSQTIYDSLLNIVVCNDLETNQK